MSAICDVFASVEMTASSSGGKKSMNDHSTALQLELLTDRWIGPRYLAIFLVRNFFPASTSLYQMSSSRAHCL